MTDPNQPKFFVSKKNGKKYKHYKRHKANERQVAKDIYKKQFEEHHNRKMTIDELRAFKCGYNMGYKEAKKRATQSKSSAERRRVGVKMDYELEQYMLRKMIIDRHAEETFIWSENDYKEKTGYNEMSWWKKIIFNFQLSKYGSKRFIELKEIQQKYIDDIMKTRTTLNKSKECEK